jgi:hypothetical protein
MSSSAYLERLVLASLGGPPKSHPVAGLFIPQRKKPIIPCADRVSVLVIDWATGRIAYGRASRNQSFESFEGNDSKSDI